MSLKKFYDAAQAASQDVSDLANKIDALMQADKIEDALALRGDLDKAKATAKEANLMYLSMQEATGPSEGDPASKFVPTNSKHEPPATKEMRASDEYMQVFMNALRSGVTPKTIKNGQHSAEKYRVLLDAISTTGGDPVGEDGGFLNPVEFDNKIIELKRKYVDITDDFNRESVITYSGWRVIEQFAAALPLTPMVELAVLTDGDEGESPKFNKIDYTLVDYGDFLRVSNGQLQDTPINLIMYLSRWFSKKLVLTHNALGLAKINAISPTAITDKTKLLGAMKTALNATLDPAFSVSAGVYTNQSGLDLLDSLVDGTGRPLLQPDPTNATRLLFKGRPVKYLSDAHWPNLTSTTRTRIAIGDMEEFAILFERSSFEFASTNVGGSAWRSNSSEVRGIARMDVETADTGAATLLTVTL